MNTKKVTEELIPVEDRLLAWRRQYPYPNGEEPTVYEAALLCGRFIET
jgi:hypothetical protein